MEQKQNYPKAITETEEAFMSTSEGEWNYNNTGDIFVEDEIIFDSCYPSDEEYEQAQLDAKFICDVHEHYQELLKLAKEAIALRAELKQQLEYRIGDSVGVKNEAEWTNDDSAQDATIEACEALLKKYNLDD